MKTTRRCSFAHSLRRSYVPRWLSGKASACPVQEAQGREFWSLGREDPLEREMESHSSILAWKIQWTEELGGLQSVGLQESDMSQRLTHYWIPVCIVYGSVLAMAAVVSLL